MKKQFEVRAYSTVIHSAVVLAESEEEAEKVFEDLGVNVSLDDFYMEESGVEEVYAQEDDIMPQKHSMPIFEVDGEKIKIIRKKDF